MEYHDIRRRRCLFDSRVYSEVPVPGGRPSPLHPSTMGLFSPADNYYKCQTPCTECLLGDWETVGGEDGNNPPKCEYNSGRLKCGKKGGLAEYQRRLLCRISPSP
mmetsp:Transcript_30121/g.74818  ORF Transcript_30121/g.74818 Transcript_30121/m.74818 type:complete len:105 (-) Transcript_30121:425-739(-)